MTSLPRIGSEVVIRQVGFSSVVVMIDDMIMYFNAYLIAKQINISFERMYV